MGKSTHFTGQQYLRLFVFFLRFEWKFGGKFGSSDEGVMETYKRTFPRGYQLQV